MSNDFFHYDTERLHKLALTSEAATLWIYSEALNKGILSSEQASSIMRTIFPVRATQFPKLLVQQCLQDTYQLIVKLLQISISTLKNE